VTTAMGAVASASMSTLSESASRGILIIDIEYCVQFSGSDPRDRTLLAGHGHRLQMVDVNAANPESRLNLS
jgi:hypothetical protein